MLVDELSAERGFSSGDIIAGRYRIEGVLGQGGMGIVVQAMHLHLRERVAMKLLLPRATHPDAVARFIREARAAARIKNDHVVHVTDVGLLENGQPYMIMELLTGEDLSALLARRSPLPPHECVEILLQVCEAIAAAHASGVIHRDLKPANLFLEQRSDSVPWVKVLDFGISKMTEAELTGADITLTQSTGMLGSPVYMSPEQVRAPRSVDTRTDIWSLGVILYQLLSGRAPFSGQSIPELSVKIAVDPTPPLPSVVPPELAKVVHRCLVKERSERFQDVAELAEALVPFAPERARSSAARARELLRGGARSSPPGADRLDNAPPPGSLASDGRTALTVSAWVQSAPAPRLRRVALYLGIAAALGGALAVYSRLLELDLVSAPPAGSLSAASVWDGTRLLPTSSVAPASAPGVTRASASSASSARGLTPPISAEPQAKVAPAPARSPKRARQSGPTPASTSSQQSVEVAPKPSAPAGSSVAPVPPRPSPFDARKW